MMRINDASLGHSSRSWTCAAESCSSRSTSSPCMHVDRESREVLAMSWPSGILRLRWRNRTWAKQSAGSPAKLASRGHQVRPMLSPVLPTLMALPRLPLGMFPAPCCQRQCRPCCQRRCCQATAGDVHPGAAERCLQTTRSSGEHRGG